MKSSINSIRLLVHRKSQSDLIVCGTNLGRSHIYDLKVSDLSNQIEYNGQYLCPSSDSHTNVGLIGQSLGASLMFSALWLNDSHYGLFRKDVEYNDHFLKTIDSNKWMWKPNFISLVEFDRFIYLFFTEIDEIDHQKRVSRIARVCKNDKGTRFSIGSMILILNYFF